MNIAAGLRNWRRAKEILSVLIFDYGFGHVVDQLDLGGVLPVGRRRDMPPAHAALSGPERLRLALGQLGPAFIKLGQMLGARADLLSLAYVSALRRLQDEAPPVGFEEIRQVVEAELEMPLDRAFARFDRKPLSAASLGQVHAARLPDGREVTVKVLRPGVERVVEADLQILSDAAYLLPRRVPALRRYDLPALVRQFASQLEDEMVYTLEAHNAERIGRSLAEAGLRVRVPAVVSELTTKRVLTAERVYGKRVDRLGEGEVGFDRMEAAVQFARAMLRQIFLDGFFHADPHQGNVLVGDDGTISLLDFGMVGYLDPRTRRLLVEAVRHAYGEDVDGVVDDLVELGALGPDTDLAAVRGELSRIVSRFVAMPPRQMAIGELFSRTLRILWVHQIRVPPELSVAAKTLLLTEAVCRDLSPDFDLRSLARPMAEEEMAKAFTPQAVAERLTKEVETAARRLGRLPSRLEHVLSLLGTGSLRLRIDEQGADERAWGLNRSINRLALSVLSGSLLVSGSIYLAGAAGPLHLGLGAAAVAGGIVLGLAAALGLLRPGRL